jgi:hypothetical protein
MFLMSRLVSRSSRSLALMVGAAACGRGRIRDDLLGCALQLLRRSSALRSFPQSSIL